MAVNESNHWHKACHTRVRHVALYPFQLSLIEPLPVDLFTTNNNNKLRYSRKMANEEQDEATSLYISFVMSMVIAQTRCTTAHSPSSCLFLSDGSDNNSNIVSFDFQVTTLGKSLEHAQNAKSNSQSNSPYTSTFSATINRVISGS